MSAIATTTETTLKVDPKKPPIQDSNVPSGFILKLFQMVNGAPDEVIRVSFQRRFVALFLFFRLSCRMFGSSLLVPPLRGATMSSFCVAQKVSDS